MSLPTRLPEAWWQHIEGVADQELGTPARPLDQLVAEVSELYTRRREDIALTRIGDALQARVRFFLARDVIKVLFPLEELRRAGALPQDRTWRVLDLGCGVGTTTFGVSWFARLCRGADSLDVQAFDVGSDALRLFRALNPPGVPIRLDAREADLRARPPLGDGYDLVLMGLVLNELDDPEKLRVVEWAAGSLAPGGAMIIVEPALREPTRALQRLRDRVAEGSLRVFAPCLHAEPCPMLASERDWCHEERPFDLPDPLARVARKAKLRVDRSTFAYLTLRRDLARLAPEHAFRVVSSRLKTKGKLELVVCRGDGQLEKMRRLDRHASEANAAFGEAVRGDVLVRSGTGRVDPDEEFSRADSC